MKDKKRKYILMIILLGVLMLLSGCVRKECEEKVKDLEFTVTKEEELPEALRQQIEEKKEGDFRFTYSDNEYLYVARGYGITGDRRIQHLRGRLLSEWYRHLCKDETAGTGKRRRGDKST